MANPFKAQRIRNGKYIYRNFILEKEDGRQSWLATKESYKVGPCYSFDRLKYQVDLFIKKNNLTP